MDIGRNVNPPLDGGISDPEPKVNPPRLWKNLSEVLDVSGFFLNET